MMLSIGDFAALARNACSADGDALNCDAPPTVATGPPVAPTLHRERRQELALRGPDVRRGEAGELVGAPVGRIGEGGGGGEWRFDARLS